MGVYIDVSAINAVIAVICFALTATKNIVTALKLLVSLHLLFLTICMANELLICCEAGFS